MISLSAMIERRHFATWDRRKSDRGDTEGDLIRKPSNISKHFKAIIAKAGVEHVEAGGFC